MKLGFTKTRKDEKIIGIFYNVNLALLRQEKMERTLTAPTSFSYDNCGIEEVVDMSP